jgi:hypothetical protein
MGDEAVLYSKKEKKENKISHKEVISNFVSKKFRLM